MADGIAGKSSATITAEAFVVLAAAAYFGLETNVSWPGPACSMPATPVMSMSGEPFSTRASMAEAMSLSFMAESREIVADQVSGLRNVGRTLLSDAVVVGAGFGWVTGQMEIQYQPQQRRTRVSDLHRDFSRLKQRNLAGIRRPLAP